MSRYLASPYGRTRPLAIKCVKYYLKHRNKPFIAADVHESGQSLKMLHSKGILSLVEGEKKRYSNTYVIPQSTIDYLKKICPEEF